MARYGEDYRDRLPQPTLKGIRQDTARLDYYRWEWQKNPPAVVSQIGRGIVIGGGALIVVMFLATLFGF
jgi:phycobilisome rod-core linker protein